MPKRPRPPRNRKTHLVLVDPQNSFCDVVPAGRQQIEHDGELCVVGAWDDMCRVAKMIGRLGRNLHEVSCTLDSHQRFHIAHAVWYQDRNGRHPEPFTLMREAGGRIINHTMDAKGQSDDLGEFTTFVPHALPWTLHYLKTLAVRRRYLHSIWPEHCLIGTKGHNVVAPLMDALLEWSVITNATPNFVTKGSNPCVEHFSAVQAEVPFDGDETMNLKADPSTQLNAEFIQCVMEADEIVLAGTSPCLVFTAQDIASQFAFDNSFLRKCVFLTDGTSPASGFEAFQTGVISEMVRRGMTVTSTKDYLA